MKYILKKISNQLFRIKKIVYNYKLNSYLKGFASVGTNCFVQFPVQIEGQEFVSLGNNISINAFVHIWGQGGVNIGSNTLIASHVSIVSVTHDTEAKLFKGSIIKKPIVIGDNVWLGSNCVILPGVTIGDNVIVGAGSVVTKDLTSNALYIGSPAKKVRDLDQFL